jgi:hypothetical protein
MERDPATTARLQEHIAQIENLTKTGELRWQRQTGSAHRFARLKNNLLILGPAEVDGNLPRYLFITPFNSPDCIEINSNDSELGSAILSLFNLVQAATQNEAAVDPFSIDSALLDRLTHH